MKKNLNRWFLAAAAAAIIFTGCSKKDIVEPSTEDVKVEQYSVDINDLSNSADDEFINMEVYGGSEFESFELDADGLPDAYQITDATADEINSAKRDGQAKRIRYCLSKLELKNDQIAKLKRLFLSYHDCKSSVIERYTLTIRNLKADVNKRLENLIKALRAGKISKAEFEKGVKALRIEFNKKRNELAKKARVALKNCYIKMLKGMHEILTDRQWKAFVACYR